MLRPQYTRRPFELMILGRPGAGKRTLSDQFLRVKDVFFSINIAEDIPEISVDRIDYILILIDLTQEDSMRLLDQALQRMDVRFLAKKLSIVVTKMDQLRQKEISIHQIQSTVQSYFDIPIFYVNLTRHLEKTRLCQQLSQLIKTNTLQSRHVSTSILKCIDLYDSDEPDEDHDMTDTSVTESS
ncbi:hypothetical protein BD560DRAFT_396066 [Blakeslea trispora]|nr:hypothetical protein BD560DRAFT_396066 [Blakeslea trispora]